ncbi:glycosyltransferase family protein [Sorangium cellulosum]|uniref:Glycosyltransferase n=1 Tax=Sorangium cellulosum TaxID=56 RepID=A0A150QRG9_SORCE|nr:glycosyltransferase family protein [Sorangium cellulosum]KYF70581.1 glycosyltransferase [Sorangium cellulosum]
MARIGYYVHGRGRGHASRALAITGALRERGHELRIYAGGQAAELLGALPEHRPVRPIYPGVGGVIELPRRVAKELVEQAGFRPDAIVSDGDLPSLLAARALGIRAVAIGHDLVFSRCRLPEGLPRLRVLACRRTTWASTRARHAVAVHFLPVEPEAPGTVVARPERRLPAAGAARDVEPGAVVCYFSEYDARGALERIARAGRRVVAFGAPGVDVPGVTARPFDPDAFLAHLEAASAVVTTAGSNVLAECVLAGKPVLALHDERHHEQTLNALLAERAGVAVASPLLSLSPGVVARFFDRARAADFARIDLERALPSAPSAARSLLDEACADRA